MGSRILSRSFQVERWDPPTNDKGDNGATQTEMDTDDHTNPGGPSGEHNDDVEETDSSSDEEDEDEDSGDVAMVPMADMLNARFGCNNVCHPASVFAHI